MLNQLVLSFLLLLHAGGALRTVETVEATPSAATETMVYVSTGSGAYAYHYYFDCQHLKRCVAEGHYKKMTEAEAKRAGRTPCKTCAKKKNKTR